MKQFFWTLFLLSLGGVIALLLFGRKDSGRVGEGIKSAQPASVKHSPLAKYTMQPHPVNVQSPDKREYYWIDGIPFRHTPEGTVFHWVRTDDEDCIASMDDPDNAARVCVMDRDEGAGERAADRWERKGRPKQAESAFHSDGPVISAPKVDKQIASNDVDRTSDEQLPASISSPRTTAGNDQSSVEQKTSGEQKDSTDNLSHCLLYGRNQSARGGDYQVLYNRDDPSCQLKGRWSYVIGYGDTPEDALNNWFEKGRPPLW